MSTATMEMKVSRQQTTPEIPQHSGQIRWEGNGFYRVRVPRGAFVPCLDEPNAVWLTWTDIEEIGLCLV